MLLSSRYANDLRPEIKLTGVQRQALAEVRNAIASGFYMNHARVCELCQSEDFDVVAEKDRYGIFLKTGVCRNCGLPQTIEVLRAQDYDHFYSTIYRRLYAGCGSPAKMFATRWTRGNALLQLARANIANFSPRRIMEVGCGDGGNLAPFAAAGYDVVGYDLDESYLRYGVSRGLDLRCASLAAIPKNEKYDAIIASHFIEHAPAVRQALRDIRDHLVPGGYVIVEVPGVFAISEHNYRLDFLRYLQNAHLVHFNKKLLFQFFIEEGFEAIYGDEIVRAIFRKSEHGTAGPRENHYTSVMGFLRTTERRREREWLLLGLYDLARFPRQWARALLRVLGLLEVVDRIRM